MKKVFILAIEGCWATNIFLVKDFFRIVSLLEQHLGLDQHYTTRIVTHNGLPVMSACGVPIVAESSIEESDDGHVVVIPAIEGRYLNGLVDLHPELLSWLQAQLSRAVPILSLSTGAALLAATGQAQAIMLATHWAFLPKMNRLFPGVPFIAHESYLQSHNVYSTGSLTAIWDMLLALLAEAKGDRFAQMCAAYLLVSSPKQLMPILPGTRCHKDTRIFAIQEWIETRFQSPCEVAQLAQSFGYSERNLKRRFKESTGLPLNQYVQRVRIDRAKKLLVTTDHNVKEIAYAVGYQNDSFFTRIFKTATGDTPAQWRKGRLQVLGVGD